MQVKILSGASLAAAAIALAVSGAGLTTSAKAEMKGSVHCAGINSCKGTSACKSASNACKGQNSCKGMGWLPKDSAKACTDAGGTVG